MLKKFLIAAVASLVALAATAATVTPTSVRYGNSYTVATWTALDKNDSGAPVGTGSWRGTKTVQIVVAAAGEQNLTIQGSMDGTNWVTLHGVQLDSGEYFALTGITASGMYTVIEDPLYVRPLISNEVGATAVDIDVIVGAIAQ